MLINLLPSSFVISFLVIETSLQQERFEVEGEIRSLACTKSRYAWVLMREKLLLIESDGSVVHKTKIQSSKTHAMACSKRGDVYVYDEEQSCVKFVSFRGEEKKCFGISNAPTAMCCLRSGAILVAIEHRIEEFSRGGKCVGDVKLNVRHICKMAENKVNDYLFIADHESAVVALDRDFRHVSTYKGVDGKGLV